MPTTTRHLSAKDLEAVYDDVMPKAIDMFNTDGELPPLLLLVSMGDEEGSVDFIDIVPPQLTMMLQRTGGTKNMMMALIASVLHEESPVRATLMQNGYPRPDMVVHLTEAWCLANKEALAELKGGGIAEHPDRQEALVIAMHTAFGTSSQMLSVDPVTRQVTYSPYVHSFDTIKGRMQLAGWMGPRAGAPTH